MRALPSLAALAASLLPGLVPPPVAAADRQPFAVVKGWEIERTVGETGGNPCLMTHAYEDKDDGNAANVVVFARNGSSLALVLVYQGWAFGKDEAIKAALVLDKKPIKGKIAWIGDEKTARALLPESILPDLLAAGTVILRFANGDADFRIPDFAAGYEALKRCDATPAAAAPQAAAPAPVPTGPSAEPSTPRLAAYVIGLSLQRALKECAIPATDDQRRSVDARMAALQPEMAPLDASLRSELQRRGTPCPAAEKQGAFQEILRKFTALSPEELAASLEQDSANRKATPSPAPKF
ncbi:MULTISPECIES: hypothetical protein [unclassified Methylobacterium]|uniref:hypothetical protein n=1 Tax=unclassified Methylobacterium TaxID=2615210 RepID=UPI0037008B68